MVRRSGWGEKFQVGYFSIFQARAERVWERRSGFRVYNNPGRRSLRRSARAWDCEIGTRDESEFDVDLNLRQARELFGAHGLPGVGDGAMVELAKPPGKIAR